MKRKIAILGAGISGLALGWFLKNRFKNSVDLIILEKAARSGGWIHTNTQKGFLFELGPRSLRTQGNGLETLKLVEELGIKDEVIVPDSSARKRYIFTQGRLIALPSSLKDLFFSPFTCDIIKGIWKDLRTPKSDGTDISIESFITNRFGAQIAERFFDPLTSGIYAGDPKTLSFPACFPEMYQWEQSQGSLIKGAFTKKKHINASPFVESIRKHSMFSFRKGMSTLTETLAEGLAGHLHLNKTVTSLTQHRDGVNINCADGEEINADTVFVTIPAFALKEMLNHPLDDNLLCIKSASVIVVNIGFKDRVYDGKGFGYLVPFGEQEEILGMVWDSCIFPQHNQSVNETRFTIMMGGARRGDLLLKNNKDIKNIVDNLLKKHLNINKTPDCFEINFANECIPQYELGHLKRIEIIENQLLMHHPNIRLLGSSFYGVSVNDCIAKAKVAADQL